MTADIRKKCLSCGKNKPLNQFYRTNNESAFPDNRYHTCSACVKESIGEESGEKLAEFLHEINRPFIKDVWEDAKTRKNHTLGEYLRTISSKPDYQNLGYADSDVKLDFGKFKVQETRPHVYDKEGVIIILDSDLRQKWFKHDAEYSNDEILQLELYFRNMKYDYDIETTAQESMLEELSVLNITKSILLKEKDYQSHKRVSDVFNKVMQDAGFRPIDKKDNLEKTGLDSLSELVAQIERDGGFIEPRRIEYEPDDIDKMLTYYVQWAQRFNDQAVSTETITNWREDVDVEQIAFEVDSEANNDYDEEIIERGEEDVID